MLKDKPKLELGDIYTGNSLLPLVELSDEEQLNLYLDIPVTPSPPAHLLPMIMSGKKIQELQGVSLFSEQEPSVEMFQRTGTGFGSQPLADDLVISPPTYEFVVIGLSKKFLQTTHSRLLGNVVSTCSGVSLGAERVGEPGRRPEFWLTVKIQEQNSGVVTLVRNTLSSMSFEEGSIYRTSSDGQTDIRSSWRLRVGADRW